MTFQQTEFLLSILRDAEIRIKASIKRHMRGARRYYQLALEYDATPKHSHDYWEGAKREIVLLNERFQKLLQVEELIAQFEQLLKLQNPMV